MWTWYVQRNFESKRVVLQNCLSAMLRISGFVESLLREVCFDSTASLKPEEGQWPTFGA